MGIISTKTGKNKHKAKKGTEQQTMKATGIVRRIDDLGRVVIPKEIRRSLRIRDGEALEIFTNNEGGVVFQKYSPIGEVSQFTMQYAEAIHKSAGIPVAICDLDNVVAAAGVSRKDYLERPISASLSDILDTHRPYSSPATSPISVIDGTPERLSYLSPIVSEGSVIGAVMSLTQAPKVPDETEKKLINTGAAFLSSQMEI